MSLALECKKLRRTGCLAALVLAGLLAAAVPVVNMAVRSENYISLPGDPFHILADANWQMMAMLNILAVICGACMMYHTEYADNGFQKMQVLPISQGAMFLGKFVIIALLLVLMLALQTASLVGCAAHWFASYEFELSGVLASAGFQLAVTLPTVMLMLVIASACKNMWISLGIGVILVFTLSIMPQDNAVLSMLPFSAPYQLLSNAQADGREWLFIGVCAAQTVLFGVAEFIYLKARRNFE